MKNGFTLIELLVVVLIIGVLAAIALPQYRLAAEKAQAAQAMVVVRALADAAERFYLANGYYPFDQEYDATAGLKQLDIEIPPLKNYNIRAHYSVYIGLERVNSSDYKYMISKTYQNQADANLGNRSLTCNIPEGYSAATASAQFCKNICGATELKRVWGSGQFGCEFE